MVKVRATLGQRCKRRFGERMDGLVASIRHGRVPRAVKSLLAGRRRRRTPRGLALVFASVNCYKTLTRRVGEGRRGLEGARRVRKAARASAGPRVSTGGQRRAASPWGVDGGWLEVVRFPHFSRLWPTRATVTDAKTLFEMLHV